MESVLKKRSPKSKMGVTLWQKRYFVLDPDSQTLSYLDKKGGKQIGEIAFQFIETAEQLADKSKFTVQIRSDPPRVFFLSAATATIAQQWTTSLHAVITNRSVAESRVLQKGHWKTAKVRGSRDNLNMKQEPKVFGESLMTVASESVQGYASPIPSVLVQLQEYLLSHQGLEGEGIFRLAPDGHASNIAKEEVIAGTFCGAADINVVANLLKVYFRDLPDKLLNQLDPGAIDNSVNSEEAGKIILALSEPQASIALWLLDLCVKVCRNEQVNKMSAKAMAIVYGPNLTERTQDLMLLHSHSRTITLLWEQAIHWRMQGGM